MAKWIEVNIGVNDQVTTGREVLVKLVGPFVESHQSRILSWHFLWEAKPWPEDRGVGVTLRWRICVQDPSVEELLRELEGVLIDARNSAGILDYCFGCHGRGGEEYGGESAEWGSRGWEIGIKTLQLGVRGSTRSCSE